MKMVSRVGVDEQDRIDRVEWQPFDVRANRAVGEPEVVPHLYVVAEIYRGGKVAMQSDDGFGRVAYVTTFQDAEGREWIKASEMGHHTDSLHDLPRLD